MGEDSLIALCYITGNIPLYGCTTFWGFPGGANGKESACQCRRCKRRRFDPWVQKIPCRRAWQRTPFLAWRIPWTEEPGRLQSTVLQRGGQDWSNLATHTHTHIHTHIHTQIYHIFFIHSSINGHLGCFHVLDIVNRAAVNTGVIYLFELDFSSFPDTCPGVELLDYMGTLF